jgi:hypothetical protein
MYDLILTGPPRTGTKTLWIALGSHPEICASEYKEPFHIFPGSRFNQEYFIKNFIPTSQTKCILDSVPFHVGHQRNRINILKSLKMFKTIKYLTFLRDPLERTISFASWLLILYYNNVRLRSNLPIFMDEDIQLNKDILISWIIREIKVPYLNLVDMDGQIDRNHIFISTLNDIEIKFDKIMTFLKLKKIEIKATKSNQIEGSKLTVNYLKVKHEINKICKENETVLTKLSRKYYNKIVNEYKVV